MRPPRGPARPLAALLLLQSIAVACIGGPPPAVTPTPTTAPSATPSPTIAARRVCPATQQLAGAIEGRIAYPAEGLPALAIYAIRVDGGAYRVLHTAPVREARPNIEYAMLAVEPGTYVVVAYPVDERGAARPGPLAGSYTPAVACGLTASCKDHAPIRVVVRAGERTRGVDVLDWYAPEGTFPPPPSGGEPFAAGETVALCNPFADEANLRASPGTAASLVRAISNGTELLVTDGPRPADGYDWYAVRSGATTGWVVGYALRR